MWSGPLIVVSHWLIAAAGGEHLRRYWVTLSVIVVVSVTPPPVAVILIVWAPTGVAAPTLIVIVDVPAEQLTQHAGPGNLNPAQLSELRELALLLAAQVVEHQLQHYMDVHGIVQSWGTQERILVCITPRSNARQMLESGARAAQRFHGQLLAVYVKQGDLTREAEEAVDENLEFARKLGAEVHVVECGAKDPIAEPQQRTPVPERFGPRKRRLGEGQPRIRVFQYIDNPVGASNRHIRPVSAPWLRRVS